MIPRTSKFPLRTDFIRFRARANKLSTPHLLVYWWPARHNASALAVVIPKKVNKLATVRNALKRLTYDTLWLLIKDKNLDCVIVYKPLPFSRTQLTQELSNELTQAVTNL